MTADAKHLAHDPVELARQLCRHCARYASASDGSGLVFADQQAIAGASLFAGPLPPRTQRAELAAAFTMTDAPPPANHDRHAYIGLDVTAHGPDESAVMTLLETLRRTLFPADGPMLYVPAAHGGSGPQWYEVPGVPLFSAAYNRADETGAVWAGWRILFGELVFAPTVISPYASTDDGQAAARMTLRCAVIPIVIPAPRAAMTLAYSGEGGEVEVVGYPRVTLIGTREPSAVVRLIAEAEGNSLSFEVGIDDTLDDLAAQINDEEWHNAEAWTASVADGYGDRQAIELIDTERSGAAPLVTLRVPA